MQQPERDTEEHQYTLQQLTDSTGVSARTVRYYITEGLLPPPVVAGPQSHYTQSHSIRLKLIGLLKDAYLPLREIRRRLTGLDDESIEQLLMDHASDETSPLLATGASIQEPEPDNASTYIALALQQSKPAYWTAPARQPSNYSRVAGSPPAAAPSAQFAGNEPSSSWRRIPVSEEAELHIREDAYQRKRERIDWLIDWARKVFD